ncbi:PqqD family peptide modification chaperone [Afipia sp. GAS231]|uniref:PqqD family peptide modification chaperone n=1 Tax=Afipia sp. GAS231 TaxID=1882747 RepID=UPI0008792E79|nr:PqqD family peptide modification chaperone [Afipia sp. GAS231]SDO34914.1 Coenzyme PQQ synthesis protein D (PqqD) [Afipia sp. GAS231]
MQDDIRPSAWVRKFPIDGGLLLLDISSNCLFAYNDSARFAWELIEAGRPVEDLESEFERAWGIPRSRARADLRLILAQWRAQGVIAGAGTGPAADEFESGAVDGYRGAPARWASEWICTIGGIAMAFAVETDLPSVRLFLSHLETPGARPQTRIEIRGSVSTEAVIIRDGLERMRTSNPGLLIGGLWHSVLECIHPNVHWRAVIHGAAVARNGIGLALAGPSGSGKTTLAAGLVSRGFDYLSDDAVPVSEPDGEIVPWPLPLSIKPGSKELLKSRFPELGNAPAYSTKGTEARLLVPAAEVWDATAVKLRALIFPRFIAGTAPKQRSLSQFDAIQNLLIDRVWLGYPITEARVKSFLDWLDDTPAHAICYGTLDDAVQLVERAIA